MKYLSYIFILIGCLILSVANATMTKYLIEKEDGTQKIDIVDPSRGGGFNPGVVIIWDESIHGQMPIIVQNNLGGYSKLGNALIVDRAKADVQKGRRDSAKNISDARILLRAKCKAKNCTHAELLNYLFP